MTGEEPIQDRYRQMPACTSARVGKPGRNAIVASLLLQAFSNILLCPIVHVSKEVLIVLSTVSRFFSGISISLGMIPAYSILTSEFPEEIQEVVGYLESAMGLGLIIGPLLGSTLYINKGELVIFTCLTLYCILNVVIQCMCVLLLACTCT